MAPFSILKRSPRGRKGSEPQSNGDDVKTADDTPREGRQGEENHAAGGSNDANDGEASDTGGIKARRGLNRELLHNLRSRLTGKQSSAPQRGTSSQPQRQQDAATVRMSPN
jgi:hypothetical protein